MKTIYIIIFLFIVSTALNAQRNYSQGYIITNDNDSIHGLIDFRTDKMNHEFCRFKKAEKAEEELFYPGDIKRYKFVNEGKYYISHEIEINGIFRNVFLEYLLQGMMNLYYYIDPATDQDYYFFQNTDGRMIAITKKPDRIEDLKIKSDQKYKGVISYLFGAYPGVIKDVNKISFDRKYMIEITKEYHDQVCTSGESCIIFENDYRKQFIKFEFSAYAGMQYSSYSFQEEKNLSESMKSLYPVIGGQINVSNPRWSRWFSLQVDLSLSGLKGKNDYIVGTYRYGKYEFDAMMATGRLGLKYIIPVNNKFRTTIEGGVSCIKLFNTSSTLYTEDRVSGDIVYTQIQEDYILPQSSYLGFNAAVGLNYLTGNEKYFFGRIQYEQCEENNGRGNIKVFQIKIGYTF